MTYSYDMTFNTRSSVYGMALATVTFLISFVIMGAYMFITREHGERRL